MPPWRYKPSLKILLSALDHAFESVRFVGGCVRDSYLGSLVADIDLSTQHTPEEILQMAHKAGLKTLSVGITHGTVRLLVHGEAFEVTTLRHDFETDGRHARVTYTKDWVEDAKRRDFTFNALSLDLQGRLWDPCNGRQDLLNGVVRFIGDPHERLKEDALRGLRYFRFQGLFGRSPPHEDLLDILSSQGEAILALSKERQTQEVKKILSLTDPLSTLKEMEKINLLSGILGCRPSFDLLHKVVRIEYDNGLSPDWRLRLIALVKSEAFSPERSSFSFSKKEQHFLKCLAQHEELPSKPYPLLYYYGQDTTRALMILRHAQTPLNSFPKLLETINTWHPRDFPVKGHDLQALGFKGPALGKALKDLEEWWLRHEGRPSREDCLAAIAEDT